MKRKSLIFIAGLLALSISGCSLKGETGPKGESGLQGEKGSDGISIVSIEKTGKDGLTDIYTITYSDGSTSTFTITNGANGQNGSDGKTPYIGENGNWWINGQDTGIKVKGNDGKNGASLITGHGTPTSPIGFDGDSYIDLDSWDYYTKSNGVWTKQGNVKGSDGNDGKTPYIGENGNWWIDNQDTGVLADYSKEDNRVQTIQQQIMSTGLKYEMMTINGQSGYVVAGYDKALVQNYLGLNSSYEGYYQFKDLMTYSEFTTLLDDINHSRLDIVIPNYISNTPVIGISDVFKSSNLKAISLSNNTRFISSYAFYNCSSLESVNFNNCKITSIPEYCFAKTGVRHIDLPNSVNSLRQYCFSECENIDVDLSNIVFFGKNCLDSYYKEYVYLSSSVDYVGKEAFEYGTCVYLECGIDYEQWGYFDEIEDNQDYYHDHHIFINCKRNQEYIYSIENNEIILYRYLGSDKQLNIPSYIDGKPVVEIGYGFCWYDYDSNYLSSCQYYKFGYAFDNDLVQFSEIILPNTVRTIDEYTFNSIGAMVYIPKSVTLAWTGAVHFGEIKTSSIAVFEGTLSELPIFFEGSRTNTISGQEYYSNLISNNLRMAHSINLSDLYYDETTKTYYVDEGSSYSLLAVMDFNIEHLVVPNYVNGKPVRTIKSCSVSGLGKLRFVEISNGITKIQKKSFTRLELSIVYIPQSVSVINSYGFDCDCLMFKCASFMQPEEWDTYWAGYNTSTQRVEFGASANCRYGSINDFDYFIENNEAKLLRYRGNENTLYLPSIIEGVSVTTILNNFYADSTKSISVYIPNCIVKAEEGAFASSNSSYYRKTFYFESETLPSGFVDHWCGGYDYRYFGQTMPN